MKPHDVKVNTSPYRLAFDYYGRRYIGTLLRVTGRGAIVSFTTKTPDRDTGSTLRARRIDPVQHEVRMATPGRASELCEAMVGETLREFADTAIGSSYTPTFLGDFWEQVLANHFDDAMKARGSRIRAFRGTRKSA